MLYALWEIPITLPLGFHSSLTMPLHTCPTDKPLDLGLWDYLTNTEGLHGSHDDPRFEMAKHQFGDAAKNFKIQHHKARMYYHEAKSEGIVEEEMSFERWSQVNVRGLT